MPTNKINGFDVDESIALKSDLAEYLPLDGSVPISGTLKVKPSSNEGTLEIIQWNNETYLRNRHNNGTDQADIYWGVYTDPVYQKVIDGGVYTYRIYGEHNKPTAADVGALPLTGGTLSGTLTLAPPSSEGKTTIIQYNSETYLRDYHSNGTDQADIFWGVYTDPKYQKVIDGGVYTYKLYGEYNITYGFSELTAGSSSLTHGFIYQQCE